MQKLNQVFHFYSYQSILAFLMGSSWALLSCRHSFYFSESLSWFASLGFGFTMMMLSAYLLSKINRLSSQSFFDMNKAVGKVGQSYLPIPSKGNGFGQVELVVDGRKRIYRAISDSEEAIDAFVQVMVVRVENRI